MIKIFIVSYESQGVRVFVKESMSASQAQQLGKSLGAARLKPCVHKLLLDEDKAKELQQRFSREKAS
jgi:hypothetical protein